MGFMSRDCGQRMRADWEANLQVPQSTMDLTGLHLLAKSHLDAHSFCQLSIQSTTMLGLFQAGLTIIQLRKVGGLEHEHSN